MLKNVISSCENWIRVIDRHRSASLESMFASLYKQEVRDWTEQRIAYLSNNSLQTDWDNNWPNLSCYSTNSCNLTTATYVVDPNQMTLGWLRVWTQVREVIYFSHYKNYIGINFMKKIYNIRCLWVWLTREFKFIYNIIFACQVSDSFILISLLANKRLQHTGINMLRLFRASNQIVFFISFIHSEGGTQC